jgi:hypothetical protein
MKASPMEHIGTDRLECEFIPPLDLPPEERRMSWEQQLNAELAWQEAGGNADGEVARSMNAAPREKWVPAGPSARAAAAPPTMGTLTGMNTQLISLMERLLEIQTEVANVAVTEMSQRQALAAAVPQANAVHSPLQPENARLVAQLANACFELLRAAQTDLSAINGLQPSGERTERGQVATEQPWLLADRRRRATVIDFPERRAAA